jgi:GntR family transcriptional regulator
MKAYEELEKQGLVTAVQGKGYFVNAQDSEMLREQHMRKMEEFLLGAIAAARVAGITDKALVDTLKVLCTAEE